MSSGKRYSKEEKQEIMHYRQNHTYQETAEKFNVSQMTLARWSRKYKNKIIDGDRFVGDTSYKTYLQVLKYLDGVKLIALYSDSSRGDAIAAITDENIGEDALFMSMTALLSTISRMTDDLKLGNLDMVITKNKKGIILIQGINTNLLIIILYRDVIDIHRIINDDSKLIEKVCNDIAKEYEKPK
jgi:predicted regulator of Ras-like GTPase activity (Roadblock/LC7/MglB family)